MGEDVPSMTAAFLTEFQARGLTVDVDPDRERVVVMPAGEIDVATIGRLRDQVQELLDAGFGALVLDLRRVDFLDSTGLRYVLELARMGRDGLDFAVIPGPPAVQRVFEVAGVDDLVPFTSRLRLLP
jgi:anti-sigma B factor antagonist